MKSVAMMSLLLCITAASASAQNGPVAAEMPEALVKRAVVLALRQIHHVQCRPGVKCAKATDAEFEILPVPVADARRIINAGVISGMAKWCGLDWQRQIFLPMMAHLREGQGWVERQIALAALLHGIYQAQASGPVMASQACPDELRASLPQRLPVW